MVVRDARVGWERILVPANAQRLDLLSAEVLREHGGGQRQVEPAAGEFRGAAAHL